MVTYRIGTITTGKHIVIHKFHITFVSFARPPRGGVYTFDAATTTFGYMACTLHALRISLAYVQILTENSIHFCPPSQ